jgi:hypothetical protein
VCLGACLVVIGEHMRDRPMISGYHQNTWHCHLLFRKASTHRTTPHQERILRRTFTHE